MISIQNSVDMLTNYIFTFAVFLPQSVVNAHFIMHSNTILYYDDSMETLDLGYIRIQTIQTEDCIIPTSKDTSNVEMCSAHSISTWRWSKNSKECYLTSSEILSISLFTGTTLNFTKAEFVQVLLFATTVRERYSHTLSLSEWNRLKFVTSLARSCLNCFKMIFLKNCVAYLNLTILPPSPGNDSVWKKSMYLSSLEDIIGRFMTNMRKRFCVRLSRVLESISRIELLKMLTFPLKYECCNLNGLIYFTFHIVLNVNCFPSSLQKMEKDKRLKFLKRRKPHYFNKGLTFISMQGKSRFDPITREQRLWSWKINSPCKDTRNPTSQIMRLRNVQYERNKTQCPTRAFSLCNFILLILILSHILDHSGILDREYVFLKSNRNNCNDCFIKDRKDSLLPSFIFRLREFIPRVVQVLPFHRENGIDLSNYLHRLGTYKGRTKSLPIRPHELASEGFYALKDSGYTKCFYCGFVFSDWKAGDDPRRIHYSNSPKCPYLRQQHTKGQDSNVVSNATHSASNASDGQSSNSKESKQTVPQTSTTEQNAPSKTTSTKPTTSIDSRPNGHVQCRRQHADHTNNAFARPARSRPTMHQPMFDKPRFPPYAILTVRISSFQGWPPHMSQTPKELALAGFYYAGHGDVVQCYFCGGKLRNWEQGDDPYVEHARWFPLCKFLLQTKGEEFINLVQETLNQEATLSEGNGQEDRNMSATNEEPLDEAVNKIQEMGYTMEHIQEAMQCLLNDRRQLTANAIVEQILESENRQEHEERRTTTASLNENQEGQTSSGLTSSLTSSLSSARTSNHDFAREESRINGQNLSDLSSVASSVTNLSISNTAERLSDTASFTSEPQSLLDENRQLRNQRLCKICLDQDSSIVFLPCGHLVCCPGCAPAMRKCPICRQLIKGSIKTWLG